jgi:hypothetical protein
MDELAGCALIAGLPNVSRYSITTAVRSSASEQIVARDISTGAKRDQHRDSQLSGLRVSKHPDSGRNRLRADRQRAGPHARPAERGVEFHLGGQC